MKSLQRIKWILASILLATCSKIGAAEIHLRESFGDREDKVAALLIAQGAGADSAEIYAVLNREEKGVFLEAFWTRHNPLVLKYYYGYHLGRRHYTVSDVFFEKGDLIYPFFYREANSPDKRKVADGVRICAFILEQSPDDAVALCGLGYFYLEQNNTDAAKKLFWKADKKQKRFMEARNGRALAILRTPKQKTQAQKLFEEIISIDRDYEAAWYNLTIAHLSLESNGVFGQFEKMVKRFPEHYDAHFKLGASNERSHYYPKAVVSYINQLNVNPEHGRARFYAARSAIELIWMGLEWPEIPGFEIALKQNPKRYLPIQAEAYLSQKLYGKAEANYKDFIALLTPKEQTLYNDISLVTTPAEQQAWEQTPKSDQNRFLNAFWQMRNPTPTSRENPRKLEHYRRVHYSRLNYSEGKYPWDRRGEVYIRFGHPDHLTWSDHMIMETDPAVVRVKRRLNERVLNKMGAMEELVNISFTAASNLGVWGRPIFPIDNLSKWESWIYTDVGRGIEVNFLDNVINFSYDYPEVPLHTDQRDFWRDLSAFTVMERAVSQTPSVYTFEYDGEAMGAHYSTADFRSTEGKSGLEIYIGAEWTDMKLEAQGKYKCGQIDWVAVLYDRDMNQVYRDSIRSEGCLSRTSKPGRGTLLVDQIRVDLKPDVYFLGIEIRDHKAQKVQIFRDSVQVEAYTDTNLALSDLEVASATEMSKANEGKFIKGDLQVVPMPSHSFKKDQSVYLYYEVYNLTRDAYGQTHYRVEYSFAGKGKNTALRFLKGIGQLAGLTQSSGEIRMSYDHQGRESWEPIYIALDKIATSGKGLKEITVQITDLNAEGEPCISKKAHFTMND